MVTIQKCYEFVKDRLNHLSTNTNQNITGTSFINAMREATYNWLDTRLKAEDHSKTRQRELEILLRPLQINGQKKDKYYSYPLPEDFYHISSGDVVAITKSCTLDLTLHPIEIANKDLYYKDANWSPSVEWEETFYTIENRELKVFYKDFKLGKINVTYYKKPVDVNIETGFKDIDGNLMVNVHPEFDDSSVYEILELTVSTLASDIGDSGRYQTALGKAQSFN